jgi:hypothetical protein
MLIFVLQGVRHVNQHPYEPNDCIQRILAATAPEHLDE